MSFRGVNRFWIADCGFLCATAVRTRITDSGLTEAGSVSSRLETCGWPDAQSRAAGQRTLSCAGQSS